MKSSGRTRIPSLVLACAIGLLSGCGHDAPSATAPAVGKVAGTQINTSEGPFGGQTVAWYEAQMDVHASPQSADNPAWTEALWCNGKDAKMNATATADEVRKRMGTVSCQNLFQGVSQAQGPYAGHDHAWFKSHPKERGIQAGWCQAAKGGSPMAWGGACFATETTGAGVY
jgi:hypothetical protein